MSDRLRTELERVVESGFAPPAGRTASAVALETLGVLDSPDPVLRDELGYRVLAEWITDPDGPLAVREVHELLRRAEGDAMLLHGLGERGTDSVFGRAFSLLVIAAALHRDGLEPFLGEEEWRHTIECVGCYCEGERDLRAHVPEKGWAHAVAHVADVVEELVRGRHARRADSERLLECLSLLLEGSTEAFQGEEDERLSIALATMVASGHLTVAALGAWFAEPSSETMRVNLKLTARSLYFRLRTSAVADAEMLVPVQAALTRY